MRQRSMTTTSPACCARRAACSSMQPSWNQSAGAPAASASSTTAGSASLRRKTSTRSTPPGISATRRCTLWPRIDSPRGYTGTTSYPRSSRYRATRFESRCGLGDRPTTATRRAFSSSARRTESSGLLNKGDLVDLPQRRDAGEHLLEGGLAQEGHALLARGLLDLGPRLPLQDHLADAV